ncbi:MAG TPA: ABC transporter substrate-binding protein [Candidatus Limnocylindrales bacterium]|nr:ABC transporter substrate-binding protein [Candidatus Limnocylindrales bacterium]
MHIFSRTLVPLALTGMLQVTTALTATAQQAATVTDVDGRAISIEDASRVATLGGVFTETAYALGAQEQVAAVDASSFYPPEALQDKPNFGYYRFLSAEPVLAQDPSLIIGNEETGPPEVVSQLRDAGIPILLLPDNNDLQAARDLITTLGTVFGRESEAADLVAALDADVAAAEALVAQATSRPRVLFILQPPEAPTLVAGGDTAAGSMISLAGGENIYPGFGSYIPMTPEGIVEAAPDVILTTEASIERLGGLDAFLATPGVAQTPAAVEGRVVAMEDLYLLGFGPRTGKAMADLARLLHPELAR